MQATRIVIAHRLSTIENADMIYVLEKGSIVESGDYQRLMICKVRSIDLLNANLPDLQWSQ